MRLADISPTSPLKIELGKTTHFVNNKSNLRVEEKDILVNFDVVLFFYTRVPMD